MTQGRPGDRGRRQKILRAAVKRGEFLGGEDVAPSVVGALVEERVGSADEIGEVADFVAAVEEPAGLQWMTIGVGSALLFG